MWKKIQKRIHLLNLILAPSVKHKINIEGLFIVFIFEIIFFKISEHLSGKAFHVCYKRIQTIEWLFYFVGKACMHACVYFYTRADE